MASKKKPAAAEAVETDESVVTEGECQVCLDAYGAAKCTVPAEHGKAKESASEDSARKKS